MAILALARAVDRFAKARATHEHLHFMETTAHGQERAMVRRERLSRCYGGVVYLLSKAGCLERASSGSGHHGAPFRCTLRWSLRVHLASDLRNARQAPLERRPKSAAQAARGALSLLPGGCGVARAVHHDHPPKWSTPSGFAHSKVDFYH